MEPLRDPREIEREMDTYRVITLGDIYRALRDHPEWAQELRRVFLTEELLDLPRKFQKFLEEDFYPLKEKVDKIEKDVEQLKGDVKQLKNDVEDLKSDVAVLKNDVEVLKNDVAVLKRDVEVLKRDVEKLKNDVGWLKGGFMELQVRDKVGAFFGKLIRRAKLVDFSDLADTLYEAVERGLISGEEAEDVLRIDAVVRGFLRKDGLKEVLIATEISFVVDREDVERAVRRAEILSQVFQITCIPAVIGKEFTEGAKERADSLNVLLI